MTAAVGDDGDIPGKIFHVLEDFQSRIHADPSDKSEDPPSRNPARTDAVTLTWHEIPAWQKDNEYILTGYRRWVTLAHERDLGNLHDQYIVHYS